MGKIKREKKGARAPKNLPLGDQIDQVSLH